MIYMTFYVMLNRDAFGRIFMRALDSKTEFEQYIKQLIDSKDKYFFTILDNVQQNL